ISTKCPTSSRRPSRTSTTRACTVLLPTSTAATRMRASAPAGQASPLDQEAVRVLRVDQDGERPAQPEAPGRPGGDRRPVAALVGVEAGHGDGQFDRDPCLAGRPGALVLGVEDPGRAYQADPAQPLPLLQLAAGGVQGAGGEAGGDRPEEQ